MPVYCFRTLRGDAPVEFALKYEGLTAAELEDGTYRIGRRRYRRDFAAELSSAHCTAGNWPMLSEALGVGEKQIPEAAAALVKAGVPTEFTRDGRAVLRDRAHRHKVLRALGLHDRSSYMND